MKMKYMGHMANDLYWFILPLILPSLLTRFNLSFGQGGGILTYYLVITALGSFLIGKLSDRMARKEILGYGFLLASLGLAATGFTHTLPLFLIIVGLTALGMSSFHPVMYALIVENAHEKKARVMSTYEIFGTLGVLIMFLVNGFLIEKIGIRGVLIVTAIPGFIMGVLYLRSKSLASESRVSKVVKVGEAGQDSSAVILLLFLLSVILRVFTITAVLNFLPAIFVKFAGFSVGAASYSTALFFAGGVIGSMAAGRLSERFNSFRILFVATLLLVPSIFAFALDLPGVFLLPVVFVLGLIGSGCIINQNLLLTRLGKNFGKGELFGILMGVMTITSAISPAIYGLSVDSLGIEKTQFFFVLPLLFSAGIIAVLIRKDEKKV